MFILPVPWVFRYSSVEALSDHDGELIACYQSFPNVATVFLEVLDCQIGQSGAASSVGNEPCVLMDLRIAGSKAKNGTPQPMPDARRGRSRRIFRPIFLQRYRAQPRPPRRLSEDLGPLLCQRLANQWLRHNAIPTEIAESIQIET